MLRKILRVLLVVIVLLLVAGVIFGPGLVESNLNETTPPPAPLPLQTAAAELHRNLRIADLHADSLLWGRNLARRGTRGHVDFPRLIDGNVTLQVLGIVTKVPRGLNIESNSGDTDQITPLFALQLRPPRTWRRLSDRALHQADALARFARESGGTFFLIRSQTELTGYLTRRMLDSGVTAGLLSIEGAHALDGNLDNLDRLYDAGIRMIGLAHFFDNEFSGSAHGLAKGGLTPLGRELVKRIELKRMLVDLAHASPKAFDEALALATRPVVVSHTGVRGTCDNRRNLSDEQLRAVARNGGVIGIGYWETAVCGRDVQSIVRAIQHAVRVAGVEHVALGSDFDGAIAAPFDTSQLVQVTQGLLDAGMTEAQIRAVMGENVLRLLRENLP